MPFTNVINFVPVAAPSGQLATTNNPVYVPGGSSNAVNPVIPVIDSTTTIVGGSTAAAGTAAGTTTNTTNTPVTPLPGGGTATTTTAGTTVVDPATGTTTFHPKPWLVYTIIGGVVLIGAIITYLALKKGGKK